MEQAVTLTAADRNLMLNIEARRYFRRRLVNNFMTGLVTALTVLSVGALVIIVGYMLLKGLTSLNVNFFIKEPAPGFEAGGGIANGIVGTIIMVLLGAVIAIPIGIGTAVFLAEFGTGWFAEATRFTMDILAGVPSIIIGLFVWATLVHSTGSFSGFAGAIALAIIMIPFIARSVEEILRLVPDMLREAGLALGTPRWRVTLGIVIPTVFPGIVTGVILAMARAAGETAPLLLTALGNQFVTFDISQPMGAIPLQAFTYTSSPSPDQNNQAFAAMLVLIVVIAIISALVRVFTGRVQYER
jgi:phosphate transport system permease protein